MEITQSWPGYTSTITYLASDINYDPSTILIDLTSNYGNSDILIEAIVQDYQNTTSSNQVVLRQRNCAATGNFKFVSAADGSDLSSTITI